MEEMTFINPFEIDEPTRRAIEPEGADDPRWWAVRQVGDDLVFSPSRDAAWSALDPGAGSPVAWLPTAAPRVTLKRGEEASETRLMLEDGLRVPLHAGERMSLHSDRGAVTLGCWSPEGWVVAAGRDRFGLWADAEVNGVVTRFRWIPPGRCRVGSPADEVGRSAWEGPAHLVTWTRGRWLGDAPVTQALWNAVIAENRSRFVSTDRPVERVSWEDCQAFLRRLDALVPGLDARLPSEAEWEYACRAGTATATWLGDLEIRGLNDAPRLDSIAWYAGNSGQDFELKNGIDSSTWPEQQRPNMRAGTHPVRHKDPNPLGLFDMLGNVFEWCLDASNYEESYAGADVIDPPPNSAGSIRILRGGSWLSCARIVRAAFRGGDPPDFRILNVGFRLAQD